MNWKALGKKVGQFAPVLGGAMGPGGALVGGLIASALGTENNPDSINEALVATSSPELAVRLRAIEKKHEQILAEVGLKTLTSELEDTQHAREQNKHSRMPGIITLALTAMVSAVIALMFFVPIPEGNKDTALLLVGTLVGVWGSSIAYWVGTTRSSFMKSFGKMGS